MQTVEKFLLVPQKAARHYRVLWRGVTLPARCFPAGYLAVSAARTEEGIYIPLMSYRTGPYSGAGAAIFNGMSDYLAMLDERDGGIGGARLVVEECETGYDTKKGVECYNLTKSRKSCRKHSVLDWNYPPVDPQSCGRQDTRFVNGLWTFRLRGRQRLSMDFQSASHLVGWRVGICETCSGGRGRLRQAKGKDDRPRSSRRTLVSLMTSVTKLVQHSIRAR